MCPACYGVGYHTIRRFSEADVLCPACLGLGRLEDKDGIMADLPAVRWAGAD
jgi:hypothetical protein